MTTSENGKYIVSVFHLFVIPWFCRIPLDDYILSLIFFRSLHHHIEQIGERNIFVNAQIRQKRPTRVSTIQGTSSIGYQNHIIIIICMELGTSSVAYIFFDFPGYMVERLAISSFYNGNCQNINFFNLLWL